MKIHFGAMFDFSISVLIISDLKVHGKFLSESDIFIIAAKGSKMIFIQEPKVSKVCISIQDFILI